MLVVDRAEAPAVSWRSRYGMFAIGYGIPPNGPLRAIRLAAAPLAGAVATYVSVNRRELDGLAV